ncbi:adhesion G-protein coupled receptor G4-like isoform X1 [Onthophagus taurus]|uniref:adhesion G-protein coupled receptor G4-like isoform X1 n=1 Tax=Onthophagus taurus TaxID=166361 RepID=UPI0039BE0DE9
MCNYTVFFLFCVISYGNGVPNIFKNVFDLECPSGFLLNERKTHCLLQKTSQMKTCPKLIDLNITYSLIPKTSLVKVDNEHKSNCNYSWEDFFKTASEDNDVTVNLIFSNLQQPFELYLDVTTKRPINDIEKKIHCWVYNKNTPVHVSFIKKYSDSLTSRYRVEINENFQQYVCYFLDAGRIPLNYTSRFASTSANYIFNAKIHRIPYESCAEQLSKDFNVYSTNLKNYIRIVGMSSKLTIMEALREFKNKIPDGICKDNVTDITNNEFCLPITTPVIGMNKFVYWPVTRAGQEALSNGICFDTNGKPLTRECIKSRSTAFGECQWSELEQNCSNSHSPINTAFENILDHNNITDSELTQISDRIKNNAVNEYEVDYITKILSAAVYTSGESAILETIDNVLNVDDKVLNASKSFGITEKIFGNVDTLVRRLVKNQSEASINHKNIGVIVQKVFPSTEIDDKNKTEVEVTVKDDDVKTTLVQVKLSNKFLTSFDLSQKDQEEIMISVETYNSKIFSNEANLHQIEVDVTLHPKIIFRNRFKEPLSIFFTTNKQNVSCVFWDEVTNNWLTTDVKTKIINSTTVECQTYHLTRFGLIIDEKFINVSKVHEIISTIESVLSFICVLIILFLATFFRKFAVERPRTVHLSFIILLENILILVEEYVPEIKHNLNCKLIGIFIHYIVLVKFTLTLMITKAQLNNFVYFIGLKRADKCFTLQETFTVWVLPAFFISIGVVVSHDKYKLGRNNFCYPKEELFYYFVVVPIGIIVLLNFIALLLICANLTCRKTKTEKDQINQLRLCIMLIFMLDIVWLLGVLANIINEGILHDILKYCHFFIAPLQGVLVFIFTVNSFFNCGQNNHSFQMFGMKNN